MHYISVAILKRCLRQNATLIKLQVLSITHCHNRYVTEQYIKLSRSQIRKCKLCIVERLEQLEMPLANIALSLNLSVLAVVLRISVVVEDVVV